MTVDVERISAKRLDEWLRSCVRDHATPALLLAVGHDAQSGEIHLYVPDEPMMTENLKAWLRLALNNL